MNVYAQSVLDTNGENKINISVSSRTKVEDIKYNVVLAEKYNKDFTLGREVGEHAYNIENYRL